MPPFRARTSRLPSFSVTAISTFVLSAFGIKPVFGRRNELLELAPEGFGQLGGSGRQNGPKPALFAEADDGRADPLVAKRYLQGRRGKVSAPLLAQVRHASYRSQCCLAGRAIPVILVRAPWPGKDAAAVDGRIHNSNSSVLSLFDQRGAACIDFCGHHEIFGKSARPGDACTDSTFAASLRVSVRGVKEPDRAGENG